MQRTVLYGAIRITQPNAHRISSGKNDICLYTISFLVRVISIDIFLYGPHVCRDSEAAELRILTASEEDRCRMQDILVRLHEQTLHEGESSQEDEEDFVPGLSLNRAFQLAEVIERSDIFIEMIVWSEHSFKFTW